MYRQILVGYVDSEQGRDAMALGRIFAQASNAQITVATVPYEDGDDLAALARAREADLIEAVDVGVDLLVLGSRMGGPVRRKIHHSVTRAVMERAACPVLIAPSGVKAPEVALA
ncbi:MAG TPA: universal stress protein [Solirubrobacterales bacterium]|nr:universal stress protein [Solirubrobacterales bacterium]